MSEEIMLAISEDGTAEIYDDTYDITIHCTSREEQDQVREAMERFNRLRWIPVSEKLPDTDDKVLCQTVTKKGMVGMVLGYYDYGRWCCGMNSNVVAWMKLPEPYKEGGQDG